MSRLFVGQKEINFLSDITKEVTRDVVGTEIIYYPINELKTKTHGIYNESSSKIFDAPIRIAALIDTSNQQPTTTGKFGVDAHWTIEVFIQYRDLLDRGINCNIGDMFSFSDVFYVVSDKIALKNSFGLPEYRNSIKISGTKARETEFQALIQGPTDEKYLDKDAVQTTFVQERGFSENSQGKTGDKRALIENGVLELPENGPREVSPRGNDEDTGSSFYAD